MERVVSRTKWLGRYLRLRRAATDLLEILLGRIGQKIKIEGHVYY